MHKKIDIYTRNRFGNRKYEYAATTSTAKTCKEAKARFCITYGLSADQVKANFAIRYN